MENWKDKLNQVTQSTISKSKEVAGVVKLNVEINSLHQNMKSIYTEVGKYVLENGLLPDDKCVAEWASKAADIEADIEANTERIKTLKNVNTCPGCGAEVPRANKFCGKCGTPIVVTSAEPVKDDEEVIDAEFSETSDAEKAQEAQSESQETKEEVSAEE